MTEAPARPCTVLIADDYREVRSYLATLLRLEGFAVIEAADGRTALQIIREDRADVVLLDVHLPVLNGLEVLRAVRRDSRAPPILMFTGMSHPEAADEAIKLGADDYLTKPIRNEELLLAIRQVLRGR